jgi:hypothetical protein
LVPSRGKGRLDAPGMSGIPAEVGATSLSVKLCEPLDAQKVWAWKKEVAQNELADFNNKIEMSASMIGGFGSLPLV